MALPHIKNSEAGRNLYDPVHTNIFEVYFTLPQVLKGQFAKDEALITEHVLSISGLAALHRAPETGVQKYQGTDRSYINPKLDSTRAEISVTFTLNLRNETDNYIYKLFKAWSKLGYDIATGRRALKKDYCADWMKVSIGNRVGDIYQEVIFKDVMIGGSIEGLDEYNYDTAEAAQITVKFISDWWDDGEI